MQLSEPERRQLAEWFEDDAWDRQIGQESSPGGRGIHLMEAVKADVAAGRDQSAEEFLSESKAKGEPPKTGGSAR